MSDPTYDFLASGGTSSAASSGDPTLDFLSSGGASAPVKAAEPEGPAPWKEAAGKMFLHAATGMGANAIAGVRSVYDLATGVPLSEVDKRNQKFISEHTYEPKDAATRGLDLAIDDPRSPLNWPAKAFDMLGDAINQVTDPRSWDRRAEGSKFLGPNEQGVGMITNRPPAALPTTGTGTTALGPIISGIGQVAAGAKPFMGEVSTQLPTSRSAPGWGAEVEAPAPKTTAAPTATAPTLSTSEAPRAAPFEPVDIPGKPGVAVDTEPVEGGLPKSAGNARADILKRVGVENARESALQGDAKAAATDWQLSRFDEPAGVAAKAQFDSERSALENHSQKIVQKTGGTLGTDEDSINTRGQTIARPFDALSDWFDQQRKKLYAAADQRANGGPITQLEGVNALLQDPKFRNTLLAKDQGNLLNSVESQLAEFRKQSPQGFSVAGAEDVRKWLNQIWTNDNKGAIGTIKGALDNDVLKGAGEDIYGPARALVQMRNQTLDNPNGISRLMEHDPQTPINRTTPFEKIPDTLVRLPVAQFDNVLKTLDTMPEEIQPLAQAAKAEIKAHLANKIHDAGNSTSGQWNSRGVEKVVKANSAKLQSAFADQPEVLRDIQDLRSAGNILSVNQSYPGAAAQAANALKRGVMSRALSHVGGVVGAGAGGVLGPLGAAGGAAVGEAVGAKAGASVAEKSAVKNWQKGIRSLSDAP
jgi:hypothetical protein